MMDGASHTPDDVVLLDYGARYFRRRMVTCVSGREVLIDLPEAAAFGDGDRVTAVDGTVVEIKAAAEPLLEVRGAALARFAWHIGNRHTPCEVRDDCLLIQRDHVLEDMLRRQGAEVAHVDAPFQPEGGAYGHGRTHSHAHAHGPHDDPNAHIPHRHG
ncbi:MAG: urease accessory protein UreE [Pseudomonadota bacterium]